MPFDPNDRDSVNQFAIKARNEGHSDEEIIDYIKKQRLSSAGTTLQSGRFGTHPERETSPAPRIISPIQTPEEAVKEFSGGAGQALPALFGAPGQAVKEGVDYAMAQAAGHPELAPTALGAGTRIAAQVVVPKAIGLVAQGIGKTVGFAGPAMQRVLASSPAQAIKTLYGKVTPGMAEQAGTEVATGTGKMLRALQPSALAKDAYVEGLNSQGIKIPVQGLLDKIRNSIPEASTVGSDMVSQARNTLLRMADDAEGLAQNGAMGIGDFVTFKENIGRQLFKSANPVLRGALKDLSSMADEHIAQEAGPAVANHIGALEQATSNRLAVLRKVNKLFSRDPQGAVAKYMKSEPLQRAMNELDAQTGSSHAEELAQLAAKKSFSPQDRSLIADRLTRLAASTMVGHEIGGASGVMTYLLTSPAVRSQAAKLGLLLSTTSVPRLATTAIVNSLSNPNEEESQ